MTVNTDLINIIKYFINNLAKYFLNINLIFLIYTINKFKFYSTTHQHYKIRHSVYFGFVHIVELVVFLHTSFTMCLFSPIYTDARHVLISKIYYMLHAFPNFLSNYFLSILIFYSFCKS